jgi:hypothetical protein
MLVSNGALRPVTWCAIAVVCTFWPSLCAAGGAIYVSQEVNGAVVYGTAYNYPTMSGAANVAEKDCRARGLSCKLLATVAGGCLALAVQSGNNGFAGGLGSDLTGAQSQALVGCGRMGMPCKVESSFCDTVKEPDESFETLICIHPVFTEEKRLEYTIISSSTAEEAETAARLAAQAVAYLHSKYCRTIKGRLFPDQQTMIWGSNCLQDSAMFRGERVYWGDCPLPVISHEHR